MKECKILKINIYRTSLREVFTLAFLRMGWIGSDPIGMIWTSISQWYVDGLVSHLVLIADGKRDIWSSYQHWQHRDGADHNQVSSELTGVVSDWHGLRSAKCEKPPHPPMPGILCPVSVLRQRQPQQQCSVSTTAVQSSVLDQSESAHCAVQETPKTIIRAVE